MTSINGHTIDTNSNYSQVATEVADALELEWERDETDELIIIRTENLKIVVGNDEAPGTSNPEPTPFEWTATAYELEDGQEYFLSTDGNPELESLINFITSHIGSY